MPQFGQEWYTVGEAAELLGCGERAVLRMIKRAEIKGHPHGKGFRVRGEDLAAFHERCERTGSWPDDRR